MYEKLRDELRNAPRRQLENQALAWLCVCEALHKHFPGLMGGDGLPGDEAAAAVEALVALNSVAFTATKKGANSMDAAQVHNLRLEKAVLRVRCVRADLSEVVILEWANKLAQSGHGSVLHVLDCFERCGAMGAPMPFEATKEGANSMNEAIKPKPFCKLFEHKELGQILVRRGRGDDEEKPGVRITFDPAVDDLAPCDVFFGVGGIDEDAAELAADNLFANMTEEIAVQIVGEQVATIQAQFGAITKG